MVSSELALVIATIHVFDGSEWAVSGALREMQRGKPLSLYRVDRFSGGVQCQLFVADRDDFRALFEDIVEQVREVSRSFRFSAKTFVLAGPGYACEVRPSYKGRPAVREVSYG